MGKAIQGGLGAVMATIVSLSGCTTIGAPVMNGADDFAEVTLPEVVHVAASAAAESYTTDLARAFSEQTRTACQVTVTTSPGAWHLLETGMAEVALVTRVAPSDAEGFPEAVDARWQMTPLARDEVVIVVHASRPIDSLTIGDLQALFGGRILEWRDLGVDGGRPEIVVQDAASTSRALFDAQVLAGGEPSSVAVVVPHDRAVVDYVTEHPDAIGYAASAVLTQGVRAVNIEREPAFGLRVGSASERMWQEIVLVTPMTMTLKVLQFKAFVTEKSGEGIAARYFAGAP